VYIKIVFKRVKTNRLFTIKKKGIEQGIEQKAIEIAKEMFRLGSDINFIHKVTKLSIDKLKELEDRDK